MNNMSYLIRTIALALLGTLICSAHAQNESSNMVKPESLEQGFVLIVKDESGMANKDNPIYLASSINGWNPLDEDSILSGRSDTRWQIVIDEGLNGVTLQFKYTLGGWDREEIDADGNSIANRSLPLIDASKLRDGERPVIELSVPQFRIPRPLSEEVRESGIYRALDVTGDVRRIEVRGGAGGAEAMTRDLLVWLPPEYDAPKNADKHYPVLYMFDGQNLFDQMPGVPGEWNVDETAQRLIERGQVEELIIVGIPHAGENRTSEYMPVGSFRGIQGDGAACLDWIEWEVMPRVNNALRTKTGREHTAIGGASLGGVMSLYAVTDRPDVFGRALIESLPLMSKGPFQNHLTSATGWPERAYVGVGGREIGENSEDAARNAMYAEWARDVSDTLSSEIGSSNTMLKVVQDAAHNEPAWSERFGDALEFLFPAQ